MGYTHYWNTTKIGRADWRIVQVDMSALFAAAKGTIAAEYDTPYAAPICDDFTLAFNGIGEFGHETFFVERGSAAWGFCKTNHKPYDRVVTAALIYFAARHGFEVSSDGTANEWQDGLALARSVWPHLVLAVPATVHAGV